MNITQSWGQCDRSIALQLVQHTQTLATTINGYGQYQAHSFLLYNTLMQGRPRSKLGQQFRITVLCILAYTHTLWLRGMFISLWATLAAGTTCGKLLHVLIHQHHVQLESLHTRRSSYTTALRDTMDTHIRSGLKRWMMAQNARPSRNEVVMLLISTSG